MSGCVYSRSYWILLKRVKRKNQVITTPVRYRHNSEGVRKIIRIFDRILYYRIVNSKVIRVTVTQLLNKRNIHSFIPSKTTVHM